MPNWQDANGIPVDFTAGYDASQIDWRALEDMPTIHQGYTGDLKIESGNPRQRVWIERTTMADGEHCDHHITVETFDGNSWVTTSEN